MRAKNFIKYFNNLVFFFSVILHCNSFSQNKTDSLLQELKKPHTDSMRVSILLEICNEGVISKDSAFDFIQEALRLSEHTKYPVLISRSHHYLSHWHSANTKNQDTILFYCRLHLEKMQRLNFIPGMALACSNLGIAYTWNSLDSSMYYNLRSVELYNKAEKFDNANISKLNLANVYLEMKRFPEAISIFNETAGYGIKTGNRNVAGLSYFNMSECYTRLGNLTDAEKCINKGCSFNDSTLYSVAYCNAMLADVYMAQGRLTEAQTIYESILKTAKENNLEYILYRAYKGMADVSFKKGLWAEAIEYKKLSWNYSYKDLDSKQSLYEMLYKCDSALGNYKSSLYDHQQYIAVRDSYENGDRLKSADALEAKYKNKEHLTKIELLDKEKEIQKASVEKQMLIRNSVIGITAILAVLALLLFNRFKLKKKIESQQAILVERKRISADMHDDLGSEFSKIALLSEMLKKDLDTVSHANLDRISSSANDALQKMSEMVWSLNPKNDRLENLVSFLRKYAAEYFEHSGMDCKITKGTEVPAMIVTGERRRNIFLSFKEALRNVIKHSRATAVEIQFYAGDAKFYFIINDNGKGIDLVNGNAFGNGIENMKDRMSKAGGIFEVLNNNGTCIKLAIPLLHAQP